MSNIQGVVERISEKEWDGRDGTVTLYSFQVGGSNRWFRTGTDNPRKFGISQGAAIAFAADQKGNVDFKTVKEIDAAEVAAAPAPKPRSWGKGGSASSASSRDDYWKDKEARDIAKDERYQAVDIPRMTFCTSQDAAVELVKAALQHDALSFGSASKGAKLGMILDYVDTLTQRFFTQRMAADATVVESEKPKAKKKAAPVDDSDGYDEEDE